jgi:lipopolysaccharide/colanic/teichoic acid biosynthesis glycosyltransferase
MRFVKSHSPARSAVALCPDGEDKPPHSPKPGLPRWFNYTAASLGICLLAQLLALFWLLVRLDSRGPAVFRQPRVGRHGCGFVCNKFRTMAVGAPEFEPEVADFATFIFSPPAAARDPRHTRLGAVLRQTSLDELPQLLNVMRGEMALVGPRPELPVLVDRYPARYRGRHYVLPGITGLAQISGRSDLTYAETMELDLQYVRQQSGRGDLMILWKTLAAVFSARGAR